MADLFFQEKGKMILLSLWDVKKSYVSEVTRLTRGTYAHTFNLIKQMEEQGIVSTSKEGRTKYVTLTPKGEDLAELIQDFVTVQEGGKRKTSKKKIIKKTGPPSVSQDKLDMYRERIDDLGKNALKKRLKKPQKAKFLRLLGRYRSLVLKLRPRDKGGKREKEAILSKIENISSSLRG